MPKCLYQFSCTPKFSESRTHQYFTISKLSIEENNMLVRGRLLTQRRLLIRYQSTQPTNITKNPITPPPQQPEISHREKLELRSSSIKDIFDGFLTSEESFDPIDTKPILKDPKKFATLSTFHRDQVRDEVEKRLRRNWNDVPIETKRMAYYISYGNYGVREDLKDTVFTNEPPQDLVFELPSKLSKINPEGKDPVHKLKPVDLMQVSEARRKEFKKVTRTLDPMSKFIVYFAALVSLIAIYRDKYIEEDIVYEFDSPLMIAEKNRQLKLEERENLEKIALEEEIRSKKSKKWYYLWLK